MIQLGGKPQWTILHHNGPLFPPLYKKHNIPIIINNTDIILSELAEEYATLYAKYIDTEYFKNKIFKKNFWKDFKNILLKDSAIINANITIKYIDDIDFKLIHNYLILLKENKDNQSKEEKLKQKEFIDMIEAPYKLCIIDGVQQNISNFKMEPPGIFIGRGNHPKLGCIKKRIMPEDVTINISKDSPIPEPNLEGHKWGKVIHDKNVIWLASWNDTISNKTKYMFTSFDSFFKSESDKSKFDLARTLKKKVNNIRSTYEKDLLNDDIKIKQLATALYLIDNLALRVGGQKDTSEKADTVGVTSLRVEHITLLDDNIIKLDFLGKDSIRFYKKIAVHTDVYKNLKLFLTNKTKKDMIFNLINSSMLNEYLNSFMKNLTSKVWRTYNASHTFQLKINNIKLSSSISKEEKLNYLISKFNEANTEVALLCNHQKNVNEDKINVSIKKYDQRIDKLKQKPDSKENKIKLRILNLKKKTKLKMKNVSLGTSKNNYIDPRIIFAFIKKYDIPPEKLFTKTSLVRFTWAQDVDKDYVF